MTKNKLESTLIGGFRFRSTTPGSIRCNSEVCCFRSDKGNWILLTSRLLIVGKYERIPNYRIVRKGKHYTLVERVTSHLVESIINMHHGIAEVFTNHLTA